MEWKRYAGPILDDETRRPNAYRTQRRPQASKEAAGIGYVRGDGRGVQQAVAGANVRSLGQHGRNSGNEEGDKGNDARIGHCSRSRDVLGRQKGRKGCRLGFWGGRAFPRNHKEDHGANARFWGASHRCSEDP